MNFSSQENTTYSLLRIISGQQSLILTAHFFVNLLACKTYELSGFDIHIISFQYSVSFKEENGKPQLFFVST